MGEVIYFIALIQLNNATLSKIVVQEPQIPYTDIVKNISGINVLISYLQLKMY